MQRLCLVGLDHTTAPVAVRERLAFGADELPATLSRLVAPDEGESLLAEATILSTCNRVEVYGVANQSDDTHALIEFLANRRGFTRRELESYIFVHQGAYVAKHLCETAAGVRSIVLGEAQIQGQVRASIETAQQVGSAGHILPALFRHALSAGKRVRNETPIGKGPASVSQAGVELARQQLGSLRGRCVLLVGSGKVSELAAQNLRANGASDLIFVNRTFANAQELAQRYGAMALPYGALPAALAQADIVISATSAPEPIISQAQVAAALRARGSRPGFATEDGQLRMLLLDLAVPRDIAADVTDIPGVRVFTVDDLESVVSMTLAQRRTALGAAQQIIDEEAGAFDAWLRSQETLPTLAGLRQRAESLRSAEVQRALRRLRSLSDEEQQVVEALTLSLVNKLLHHPTLRLKEATAVGEGQRYAALVRELFALEG